VNLRLKNNETLPPLESLTHCPDMLLWPGVGVTIQLTLPPLPARAAWWQPTLLIHVAWVRRVWNEKQGAPLGMLRLPLW
ncbi:MAG: hypothetical protein P1P72_03520, partial [ANME-2 cluster archaeon]|nr:hypothetical protein [ANME-2 cluster archaeon]